MPGTMSLRSLTNRGMTVLRMAHDAHRIPCTPVHRREREQEQEREWEWEWEWEREQEWEQEWKQEWEQEHLV
jgi:hypothetical protein